ncbi:GTPase Era [Dissostichus eleginoides]|uniref:GTPase Era n=1 Tax=Dissostichus eleginoides TaxID=100907 RepID=A0AAD9BHY2_DISEL|nr:GTPase Era [Dissostichus eleginoides]
MPKRKRSVDRPAHKCSPSACILHVPSMSDHAFANYERSSVLKAGAKDTNQAFMSASHEKAFVSVLEHIGTHVVQQNEVLQLSSLRLLYVEELKLNGYENTDYRSEKLLKQLQKDPIKEHIQFMRVDHDNADAISFWLVYSLKITVSNAVAQGTSAFKGKGKVGPLKRLEKNPKFHRPFSQLGDNWNVKAEVLKQLEQFTCLIYGESRESSVGVVRAKLLRKMVGEDDKLTAKSKVDLARLLPCYDALKPHVQRVNHRLALYKRADESILEGLMVC